MSGAVPSSDGTIVFLSPGPDTQVVLDRVPRAGGRILTPRTRFPGGTGHFALFADSEGNTVGLHSRS